MKWQVIYPFSIMMLLQSTIIGESASAIHQEAHEVGDILRYEGGLVKQLKVEEKRNQEAIKYNNNEIMRLNELKNKKILELEQNKIDLIRLKKDIVNEVQFQDEIKRSQDLIKQLNNEYDSINRQLKDLQEEKKSLEDKEKVLAKQLEENDVVDENDESDTYLAYLRLEPLVINIRQQDESLYNRLEELSDQINQSNQNLDRLLQIDANQKDFEEKIKNNQIEVDDLSNGITQLELDLQNIKKAMVQDRKQDNLKGRNWKTFKMESQYYSWSDSHGNHGRQLYQPISMGIVSGQWDYEINTGYISSNNQNAPSGKVSTVTDTDLNVSYSRYPSNNDSITYSVGMNLPTGRQAINGFNPVMTEDLVALSRFGEGFNLSPGLVFKHKIGLEDTWSFQTYYTFSGTYDLDNLQQESWVEPGDLWVKTLQWQHANEQWQMLLQLTQTSYKMTREKNLSYKSGDKWEPKVTVNYVLSKSQNLMGYYWFTYEKPLSQTSFNDYSNDSQRAKWYGIQWVKSLGNKERLKVSADFMNKNGQDYDPLTNLTTNNRKKKTFGLGYEYDVTENKQWSFDIEWFTMKDEGVNMQNNQYHGVNAYLCYKINL